MRLRHGVTGDEHEPPYHFGQQGLGFSSVRPRDEVARIAECRPRRPRTFAPALVLRTYACRARLDGSLRHLAERSCNELGRTGRHLVTIEGSRDRLAAHASSLSEFGLVPADPLELPPNTRPVPGDHLNAVVCHGASLTCKIGVALYTASLHQSGTEPCQLSPPLDRGSPAAVANCSLLGSRTTTHERKTFPSESCSSRRNFWARNRVSKRSVERTRPFTRPPGRGSCGSGRPRPPP